MLKASCPGPASALAESPWVLLLCVIGLVAWLPWIVNRWRFRHIPGPFAPPVLGNLLGLAQHDLHGFIQLCRLKYGKIFKIYIGSNMIVCVADPSAAKRMCSKLSFRHAGIQLTAGEEDWDFLQDGLVGANGATWRSLRAAWAPAFHSSSLESYAAAMNTGAAALVQQLAPAAASGEEVDLYRLLGVMTLDVLGQAAYGVDLASLAKLQEQSKQQLQEQDGTANGHHVANSQRSRESNNGSTLLDDIRHVFAGGGMSNSSNYLLLVLLFPTLAGLVQALARRWPDTKLRRLAQARWCIGQVSKQLLNSWRLPNSNSSCAAAAGPAAVQDQSLQQQEQQGQQAGADPAAEEASVAAAAALRQQPAGFSSVPGVFPAVMLAARDKETGRPLEAEQVISQFNTFIVAAFETSASAVAYCVYFISQHPQVQQQLLQEVDAFGRERPVSFADLEQFPVVAAIMNETLRLIPPGAIATRSVIEPQGYQLTPEVWLPQGTALFNCIYCLHRDPEYWPDAEAWRPERWLNQQDSSQGASSLQPNNPDAFQPFGAGGRLCVGMRFAQQEVATTVVRLYQRYTFQLQPGQVPLAVKQTFALIPAAGLRVTVQSRTTLQIWA